MFDARSRYIRVEQATYTDAAGVEVTYVRRRFLPQRADLTIIGEVEVRQGERLDVITARALGDPEQFWRICDANDALDPADLTEEVGARLKVPLPSAG